MFAQNNTCRLRRLALSGVAAGALASVAGAAMAQDSDDQITVTGSRIQRSDVASTSPISVFDATELETSGVSVLEDFATQITFAPGGETNSRVNNGSGGQATISLRGLGANRTLVLVNGRRVTPANTGGYADLNMIPVSAVGRIEVLRDGASTVYGSDAIAGVVNIITKKDLEGVEFFAQHDRTDKDDGIINRYGLNFGGALPNNGNIFFNMEYYDRGEIRQGDRDFSACPFQELNGQIVCGGSGTSYPAHIFDLLGTGNQFVIDGGTGNVRTYNPGTDLYNFAERSYMVTPMEVWNAFSEAEMDVADSDMFGNVTAFGEFMFGHRSSQQQMAPVGTFWFPQVPVWHPNNPFGTANIDPADPLGARGVFIARRLAELENGRFFTQDASSWRALAGLKGELPSNIAWDASLSYGRYTDARVIDGQVNPVRAAEVLCNDPASIAAGSCASAAVIANPALIWDPFRTDTLTDTIANYMLVRHSPVQRATRLISQLNFAGDLGGLQLPGGAIDWAVGYEHRRDTAEFVPDGAAQIGQIYFVSGNATAGEVASNEFFGELRLPILSDQPMAEVLALELSGRHSTYDVNGTGVQNSFDADTYKVALEWAPNSDIRFRGTYSTGFRAPSIGELFAPQQQSAVQYTDPCVNWGTNPNIDANTLANCQTDGVPSNFTLTSTQAASVLGGNPNLSPEESESITVGAVFTPTSLGFLDGVTIGLDYFNFKITDAVGAADVNTIVSQCYASPNFTDPLCALIAGPTHPIVNAAPYPGAGGTRRSAVGVVAGVLQTNANLSTFETSGIDFNIDYQGPSFDFMNSSVDLALGLNVTYLDDYTFTVFSGATPVQQAGFFAQDNFTGNPAAFAKWTVASRVGLVAENWNFNWTPRYMSATDDVAGSPANLDNVADAIIYHDVQANWDWKSNTFTLGVRNLTDEDPPYVTNNDDMNTINQSYDTAGRYLYGRITLRR